MTCTATVKKTTDPGVNLKKKHLMRQQQLIKSYFFLKFSFYNKFLSHFLFGTKITFEFFMTYGPGDVKNGEI